MSYDAAIDALKAALEANPIHADHGGVTLRYIPDPRVSSLAEHPLGAVDGAFLIMQESQGNQYPYSQGVNANDYYCKLRLEICTLLTTDVLTQEKTAEARQRAVYEVLCLQNHSTFVIFDDAEPQRARVGEDMKLITTWRFSMRYVE